MLILLLQFAAVVSIAIVVVCVVVGRIVTNVVWMSISKDGGDGGC